MTSLQKNANLTDNINFLNAWKAIWITLIAIFAFCWVNFLLVQCIPQFTNYVMLPACVVILIFGINLVKSFATTETVERSFLSITMIVVTVIILISVYTNCFSTRLHAIFMKAAAKVVIWRKSTLVFILLHFVMLFCFLNLMSFEWMAFRSISPHSPPPSNSLYYQRKSYPFEAGIVVILFIQLIWGISFIR